MKTPAPASNLVMRDWLKPRRTGPAAIRNVTGWNGRDASYLDSFDRARQQRLQRSTVIAIRPARLPEDQASLDRVWAGVMARIGATQETTTNTYVSERLAQETV